jgi:hypothetical protein
MARRLSISAASKYRIYKPLGPPPPPPPFSRIIKPSSSLGCCFTTANAAPDAVAPAISDIASPLFHSLPESTFAKLNIAETVKYVLLLTESV